jgi:hypothetical protein
MSNTASDGGYDPETPEEAKTNSENYVNTFDTLITLNDFTNATKRLSGVANCIALDCTNDPSTTAPYTVNIYIVRTDIYAENDPDAYREEIATELASNKMITLNTDIKIDEEGISFYYWSVVGEIYTNEPVDSDKALDILNKINSNLKTTYSVSNVDFNTEIKFIDVIDTINNSDSQIHYVDLKPIVYYKEVDSELVAVDSSKLSGKSELIIPMNTDGNLTYSATLQAVPVKPGSVTIRFNGGLQVLKDDGNGKISNVSDILQNNGSIDYSTGKLNFILNEEVATDITVTYKKNVIALAKYMNLNSSTFRLADDSLIAQSSTPY